MSSTTILSRLLLFIALVTPGAGNADTPALQDGVITIHLDEYNGYFAARETLVDLKAGDYQFVITNKAGKLVGFWLQDNETHAFLDKFPLEPGQARTTRVTISENGFRYRCPINPTPWYAVAVKP